MMRSAVLIAFTVLLCTCARPPSLLEQVQASGELRVVTRNSPITYYLGAEGPEGPEYDLVRGFAEHLGVKLALEEADRFGDLLGAVEAGEAHMAAAGLTVTQDRAVRVDFGPPYQQVSQYVVYRRGRPAPRTVADLVGRRLEVVAASSYVTTLERRRSEAPGLAWTENPAADASELLNRVARGEIDYTVVDSTVFQIYQRFHPELRVGFELSAGDALAWAFPRQGDRTLIAEAQKYLEGLRASGQLDHIMDRYYGPSRFFDYRGVRKFMADYRSVLPAYRPYFEAAARRADLDWRLVAAVAYQESHWNPAAESPKGALGIMMLTADTAALMQVADRADAPANIVAGTKYLWRMRNRIARLAPGVPEPDRTWMALAAYNMGWGHLLDARRITTATGGNPDRWVDVKQALPLLQERRWYSQARWGYARTAETLAYVRNVRNYYDILVWLTEGRAGGAPGGPPPTVTAEERAPAGPPAAPQPAA
jgi:membrane-bound lytic murein transglycosylase F